MSEPVYVEIGPRLYELRIVEGKIVRDGRSWLAYVDHGTQEILLSDVLPLCDRPAAAAKAVSVAWRAQKALVAPSVPFVGRVA